MEMTSAAAFEALYDAHFSAVVRALTAYGIPNAHLEDALQEVFLVAYRRAVVLDGQASERAWLCGIARRVASRWHRTTRRRERRLDALAMLDRGQPDPERTYACHEAASRLATLLAALDPNQREAFVLSDVAGLTRLELAAALGVNPNTAWGRVRAARAAIARSLGGASDVEAVLDDVAASRPELRARVLGVLVVRIGTGAVAASTMSSATVGLVAAITAITVAVIGAWAFAPARADVPAVVPDSAPVSSTRESALVASQPASGPTVPTASAPVLVPPPRTEVEPARAPTRAPKVSPVDETNDLARERTALSEAREQLQRDAPAQALTLLDAYAREFPNGAMATEATRLRVLALCRGNDVEAARRLAGEDACKGDATRRGS